jgi:predicted dehydrogenase
MTQLNVAVVGLRFGRTWVNGFRNHPDCRVLTLCDINADVLQQNATDAAIPSTSSDLDDVLSDPAIDVVALFTPAPLHAEQSARSLRAGKHVLSAVPAAVTVDGCREIVMAAKESGRTYMMAENWPYEPSVLKAKSLYDSGNIGTLFYGEAEYIHHTESLWFSADGEPTWRHTLAPLLYPTHGLGPYLHMTGDRFTEVTAHSVSGDIAPGTEPGRSWLELAVLRSERGILFKLLNSFCNAHPGGHYLSLYGDKGSFESGRGKKARSQAFAWSLGDEPREMAEEMHEYPPLPDYAQNMGSHAGPAVQIIDDFVSAILEGRPAPIGPELAVNMTLPGIAAVESIQKNRTVSVANPADWL